MRHRGQVHVHTMAFQMPLFAIAGIGTTVKVSYMGARKLVTRAITGSPKVCDREMLASGASAILNPETLMRNSMVLTLKLNSVYCKYIAVNICKTISERRKDTLHYPPIDPFTQLPCMLV